MSDPRGIRQRILLDANLVISYLLKREGSSDPIFNLFEMIFAQQVEVVLPENLVTELREVTTTKPYLVRHVDPDLLNQTINQIAEVGVQLPLIVGDLPSVTGDRKDDYLIAAALLSDVDILVSGDKHILAVRNLLERPRIMTPADFVAEFGAAS